MNNDFEKVVKECARWGVKVRFVKKLFKVYYDSRHLNTYPAPVPEDFSDAPFTSGLGLSVKKKTIFIEYGYHEKDGHLACSVLHELAHILMGKHPEEITFEVDCGMLAVEYYTAQKLKLVDWDKGMANYQIDDGDWSHCTQAQKLAAVTESAKAAHAIGLLKNNKPTYKTIKSDLCTIK